MTRKKSIQGSPRGLSALLVYGHVWLAVAALVVALGCGEDTDPPQQSDAALTDAALTDAALPDAAPPDAMLPDATPSDPGNATFSVRDSVNQVHVWKAKPGTKLVLEDANGKEVAKATSDAQGGYIFRKIPAGKGYIVRAPADNQYTRKLNVMSVENSLPPQSFYSKQKLVAGFQYIKTRDGTTLSAFVTLPGPIDKGPYPTTIAYTGYNCSEPGKKMKQYEALCGTFPTLCSPPSDPSSLLTSVLGYATVSVNIRGTGCSGGAYDYFEPLQILDGYDIIETVATQSWVLHNKVGMTGVSFGGNSQMFVAQARPPSLAAITPASVIGDSATTIFPGGMLNDGFALGWVDYVLKRAKAYGQGWEKKMVDAGDKVCEDNQLLRSQMVDNVEQARNTKFYDPKEHDQYSPASFVSKIKVPVFLMGGWQDEQTGPFFTELMDKFTGSPAVRMMTYNGVHGDCFQPQVLSELKAFLDLFVAKRVPSIDKGVVTLSPLIFKEVYDTPAKLPELTRFAKIKTHAAALALWKKEPTLHNFFDSGGKKDDPGAVGGLFKRSFAAWPPTGAKVLRYYLQPDGTLGDKAPTAASSGSSFEHDPKAGQRGNLKSGSVDAKLPKWSWQQLAAGKAAVFDTPALTADHLLLGNGSADLWVKSTASEADLQVTISEVRPDGQEMFVQSGWLKASRRKLNKALSTELWPRPSFTKADYAPLTPGKYVLVRVAFGGFGHPFRKGSKIRLTVDTPGGNFARWRFELEKVAAGTVHTIGHDVTRPSSLALSLLPGDKADTPLPACPSLRGQPCRTYKAYTNTAAK